MIQKRAHRDSLKKLTDKALITGLEKLRGEERAVQVRILYYLNELERRRLYLPRGYSSLFEFCTGYLKYSSSAAGRRIRAARCIGRFPRVAKLLRSGELSLTAISMISGIINNKNMNEILSQAKGRSTRDIEMLVSRHRLGMRIRDRVGPVCVMTAAPAGCKAGLTFAPGAGSEYINKAPGSKGEGGAERVLISQKFKLEFSVDPEFMSKLSRIKYLLSTKYPEGIGFEEIFNFLMNTCLERHAPEH